MGKDAAPVETPVEDQIQMEIVESEAEVTPTEEAAVEEKGEEVEEKPEIPEEYGEKVQKRINKAVRRQREAEEQAAYYRGKLEALEKEREAKAPPTATPKPKVEDFDDYDEYIEALTDWKVDQQREKWVDEAEQRILEKQNVTSQDDFQVKMREASERYEDFDEVVRDPAAPINSIMADIIRNSDMPGDLAYYLCTHRQDAMPLYHMRDSAKIALGLGKIEAKIQAAMEASPKPKTPDKSKAPSPIEPVGGGGGDVITKDPNKMSYDEYKKARQEGRL